MSDDDRRHSTETRLSLLEENLRRIDTRLNEVSSRTHTLISSVTSLSLSAEEAHDQRSNLLKKIDDVQGSINTLNTASVLAVREMSSHVVLCDKRGARLEKIGWSVLSVLVPILGFLLLSYLTRMTH